VQARAHVLLVIFGAGATHDSSIYAQGVNPPPLADRLFDERVEFGDIIDRYPQVRALVRRLRAAATSDTLSIEEVFELIATEAKDRAATRRHLAAAQFYVHDAIETSVEAFAFRGAHGVTNYHELVNRIDVALASRNEPVMYITFNYDQLLETALDDTLEHDFAHIASYINRPQRRVIKLHGSVNWRRGIVQTDNTQVTVPWFQGSRAGNARWLLDHYEGLRATDHYEVGSPHEFTPDGRAFFPAIAVPTEKKTAGDFALPPDHLAVLRNALPHVTQALVVGWRGREGHFWQLWHETRPHPVQMNVVVVDRDMRTASDVARHLMVSGIAERVVPASVNGFSGYMGQPGLGGLMV
jgi:hypothetical protein